MDVLAIQKRLRALGFNPGPLDGRRGKSTKAAIKAFQVANGLASDGIAGPNTRAALFPVKRPKGEAPAGGYRIASTWPRQRDCTDFYGAIGTRQVQIEVPYEMRLAWDQSVIVRKMSLHEKVAPSALHVLEGVGKAYSAKERKDIGLDLFGGSFNVRRMRGGSAWSMHSWGIAIDFDPERNQLRWGRDKARLAEPDAEPFWLAWEEEGWLSLGRARNYDWMHVQAARL
ncbi:MAG: peptidoglycan-binding protein [Parvibaculaceae bacterium]